MKMGVNKKLAAYLKTCREKSGLTQTKLASYTKATCMQGISNIERGVATPANDVLRAYSKVTGANRMDMADLVAEHFLDIFKGKKK